MSKMLLKMVIKEKETISWATQEMFLVYIYVLCM